jgi:hypothetical protein
MDRRFHERWPADAELRVMALRNRDNCGSGRLTDISNSGLCFSAEAQFSPGELIQLDVANSVLFGHVAYCIAEGSLFRTGVEIVQVLLGRSELSKLLQSTLKEAIPDTPGLEPSKLYLY